MELCEISRGSEVGRYRTADGYVAALSAVARNRVHHGLRAGTVFEPAESASAWAECYELLAETKHRRGVQFKVSLGYLMNLRRIFGPRIAMHRLLCDGELAAATLVYRVAPTWDCLVAWGDDVRLRGR